MSEFINTVDVLGDDAVTDSIINRTITEFKDDVVTSIGSCAFAECSALKEVVLLNVLDVAASAFYNSGLEKADFHKVTSFAGSVFQFSDLQTLIIRSPEVASLGNTSSFPSTPISSGSGYIYVPAALIDSYRSATNWSTYASAFRAIEDYPDICGG